MPGVDLSHRHSANRPRSARTISVSLESKTEHHSGVIEASCTCQAHCGQGLVGFTGIGYGVDSDREMSREECDDLLPFAELDSVVCPNTIKIVEKLVQQKCGIRETLPRIEAKGRSPKRPAQEKPLCERCS